MSWDVILFNSQEKITSIEDMDDTKLLPVNFCAILEKHFEQIQGNDNHREIKGRDFTIDYFMDEEEVSNKMLSLYGENAIYELIVLAKKSGWQIFDTGLGEMIDLENPSQNGYANFQRFLKHVLKK